MEKREVYESNLDLARADPALTPLARKAFALMLEGATLTDEEMAKRIGCGLKPWLKNLDALRDLGYMAPGAHEGQAALWPIATPLLRLNMLQASIDAQRLLRYINDPSIAKDHFGAPDKAMAFLADTAQLYHVGILGAMSAVRFISAVFDAMDENERLLICLFGKDFDQFRGLLNGDLREKVGMRPTVGVAISDKHIYIFHDHPNASSCQMGGYTLDVGDRAELGQVKVKTIPCTMGPEYKETLCVVSLSDGFECATIELPALEPLSSVIHQVGVPVEVEDTAWA